MDFRKFTRQLKELRGSEDQPRRIPIGFKIFIGLFAILLFVFIANFLFLFQLDKLNRIIRSTSTGMYRINLAQRMRRQLNQQKSYRTLFHTANPAITNRDVSSEISALEGNIRAVSREIHAKLNRTPQAITDLEKSIELYHQISDSIVFLTENELIVEAHSYLNSESVAALTDTIQQQISTISKRYGINPNTMNFSKLRTTLENYVFVPYYILRFNQENQKFRADAESLAILTNKDSVYSARCAVMSDTLAAIFASERKYNTVMDSAWSETYAILYNPLEDILLSELSGVADMLKQSTRAVGITRSVGIAGTIVLFIMGILIAWIISRKIASPIADLRAATHSAKRGEWDKRIPVTSRDEIGDLTEDFNAMLVELGKLDELKTRFLASITHDLKSPIGRVRGNIANLQDGLLGPINEGQQELLDMMAKDVDKLSRLIHDILDLQKMKAGAFKLEFHTVELKGFILATLEQHKKDFYDRDIELGVKLAVDGVKVDVDPKQFERLLDNLVTNAVKYTSSGGLIVVEALVKGNEVLTRVIDTGVGIPKEHLIHIFDEFYQVDQKIKGIKGTGLGLTIAKQIVEAHDGRIWVESEPQVGTAFAFTLPLK